MTKPFQESAESLKAKVHLSKTKTPVVIGIAALMLLVFYLILQNTWSGIHKDSFEIKNQEETASENSEELKDLPQKAEEEKGIIIVHVAGAVISPGVFQLNEGDRLSAAIEAAGGLREDGMQEGINLARVLIDGEQIIVPSTEEYYAEPEVLPETSQSQSKININIASAAELTALPGIGEVTAKKIVDHREKSGSFSTIEDLTQISGIGDKKFEQIADLICV